jgi:diguanylate cyclase (GGDEF)-like protein
MSDHVFQNVVILKEKHTIESRFTDEEAFSYLRRDMFLPFEDRFSDQSRADVLRHLEENDHHWFFARLKEEQNIIAVRYLEARPDRLYLLTVNTNEELDTIYDHANLLDSYEALESLRGDIYFIGDNEKQKVILRTDGLSKLKPGQYTEEEFFTILKRNLRQEDEVKMKEMMDDILNNGSRGKYIFAGNLVDEDEKVKNTIIRYCSTTHHDGTTSFVGTLHAERERTAGEHSVQERDDLTGLLAKKEIEAVARKYCSEKETREFTLCIIDVDFFKSVNDTYGHATGDAVLKKVALILQAAVGSEGSAGRFGGDEFLLVINTVDEKKLRLLFSGIHTQVSAAFPSYGPDHNRLSVSIGSASYPGNSTDYDSLFFLADHCLYIAKKKGRDRFIIYTPEKHGSIEEIMRTSINSEQVGNREENDPAEMIVNMFYRRKYGNTQSMESLLKEFANGLHLQNVMVASGEPYRICCTAGEDAITDPGVLAELAKQFTAQKSIQDIQDFLLISSTDYLGEADRGLKECLLANHIPSIAVLRFLDHQGKDSLLVMTSVGKKQKWNRLHVKYYRLFTDLLSGYDL